MGNTASVQSASSSDQASQGYTGPRNASVALRNLTDMFISRRQPSDMEILRFEDMACKLAKHTDTATLAYVAARISTHPHTPVILIDTLLQQDVVCAKILVEHCGRVSPRHLLRFAEDPDASMAAAVARRRKVSPALARALAERTEPAVLRDLAANPQVELTGSLLEQLVSAARHDPVLAKLVIERAKDALRIAPLFLAADPGQRLEIVKAAEQQAFKAADIASIRLVGPAVVNWLLGRDPSKSWDRIAAELSRIIEQPPQAIAPLLHDPRGDGLAVLFAAIGMPGPEAVRFLLHCPPGISHSSERVRTLSRIIEAMPAHAARWLIRSVSGAQNVETMDSKTIHQPVYQPLHDISAAAQPRRREPATSIRTAIVPTIAGTGTEG